MFKFTLYDKFRQRGISPDVIPPEMRNRFDAIFEEMDSSSLSLDRKLQVRFDEQVIRFFYYTEDINEDVLLEKNYKEVASISLTNVKETGHDILCFKKQVEKKAEINEKEMWHYFLYLKKQVKKEASLFDEILRNYCDALVGNPDYNRLQGFPFVEQFKNTRDTTDIKVLFSIFMQCCLLYFILDMENRSSDLALSPLYEDVRLKLHQSDVYQLLFAKLKYTLRLYEDASPLSQEDYTFVTRKFADRLMNLSINKIIPSYNYPEKNEPANNSDKQLWFYNPETELEAILDKNREQELLSSMEKPLCLEDTLVLKIRDFFYSKHAVYQAMTRTVGKRLFLCAQILMAITSLAILVSSLYSKQADNILHKAFPDFVIMFGVSSLFCFSYNDWKNQRKNQKERWGWKKTQLFIILPLLILLFSAVTCIYKSQYHVFYTIVIGCIIIWIFFSEYLNNLDSNKKANGIVYTLFPIDFVLTLFPIGSIHALFPRILAAELTAWFTIGIAEDLVKSMLWIEGTFIPICATIFVILLIKTILSVQIKKHSPYKHHSFKKKVLPILNHSLFFALFFGLLMQIIFYNNLIKNSDVMTSVVFNDYFDNANYYCELLEDLDNTITQYENLSFLEASAHTNSKSEVKLDSASINTNLIMDFSLFRDLNEYISIHNGVVTNFNDISLRLEKDSISLKSLLKTSSNLSNMLPYNSVTLDAIKTNSIDAIRSVRDANLKMVISMRPLLCNEISRVRSQILKCNNYDTLMNWATIGQPSFEKTGSHYLDTLTSKAIKDYNCCKQIKTKQDWLKKILKAINIYELKIFPTLLIFHTLIVLVLAFVTQLFISDKSVTETL